MRTHLSALVNHNVAPPDRPYEAGGLSKEVWSKYQKDCKVGGPEEADVRVIIHLRLGFFFSISRKEPNRVCFSGSK